MAQVHYPAGTGSTSTIWICTIPPLKRSSSPWCWKAARMPSASSGSPSGWCPPRTRPSWWAPMPMWRGMCCGGQAWRNGPSPARGVWQRPAGWLHQVAPAAADRDDHRAAGPQPGEFPGRHPAGDPLHRPAHPWCSCSRPNAPNCPPRPTPPSSISSMPTATWWRWGCSCSSSGAPISSRPHQRISETDCGRASTASTGAASGEH